MEEIKNLLHFVSEYIMRLRIDQKFQLKMAHIILAILLEKLKSKQEQILQKFGVQEVKKPQSNIIEQIQIRQNGRVLKIMRKVDKKQIFNGFDQAILLKQTFAHRFHFIEVIEKD
ncbi:unnamed protein product [Paramecium sonneborni]|uniref:Uncharacterized protein n=1 Tax=Paramecium sonneborni TaxID=65129 RepID=A0A8S1RR85_9CILI|nr:unnamed protein product [Paramecium sonneborni]